jgi:hypothetical protein
MVEFLEYIESLLKPYPSIINTLMAIGTVGAVIIALRPSKTNLKISADIQAENLILIIKNNSLFTASFSQWGCCYFNFIRFTKLLLISNPTANSPTTHVEAKSDALAFINLKNIVETISRKDPKFARLKLRWANLYFVTKSGERFKVKITKKVREQLIEHAPDNTMSWHDIRWAIWMFMSALLSS